MDAILFHSEQPLPGDIEACHRLIASMRSRHEELTVALELKEKLVQEQASSILELKACNDKLTKQNVELTKQNVELNLKVEKLLHQLYGRSSERRIDTEGQLYLDLHGEGTAEDASPEVISALNDAIREAEQVVADANEKKKNGKPKRPRRDNRKFPEHLPRTERTVDLPDGRREGLKFIGYDEVERLLLKRAELHVEVVKYAKYAVPADPARDDALPGIISPERPTGLVEGDRFDASIGAEVIAGKYFYHLPYYRQQDLFAGLGWTPSRSTLVNIETQVEFALQPLAAYLRSFLKTDSCVGCDDTGVVLITPAALPDLSEHPRGDRISEVLEEAIGSGKPSIKAHFWGYHASRLPVVAFDFTVSRHRDGPDDVLSDYEGTLLGDCWSGFQKIDVRSDSRITFAACWAHARRKIDECRGAFPIQVARLESLIRMLYDVEDQIRQLDDAARLARRQSLSRHVLGLIDEYLSSDAMTAPAVLPKSNLGQAAAYVRRHWEALNRFTDDARIPIDNNDCEQLMRRIATGRKNWLFKGSPAAGERAANLMTIVGSAVRNDLDVHAYLDDVLRRVLAGETQWASLAPHAWKAEHPESIRLYRQEERRQAADRRRTRRASRRMPKT